MVAVALPVGAWVTGVLPHLRFASEDIRIRVGADFYVVEGDYTYANPWPVPLGQGLDVPFPDGVDPPQVIEAWTDAGDLPVRWFAGRPRLAVRAPALGDVTVHLRFRHPAPEQRGVYLVTSTRRWGRPLQKARFSLGWSSPHAGDRFTSSTLHPVLDVENGGTVVYRDFWPDAEWRFSWEVSP